MKIVTIDDHQLFLDGLGLILKSIEEVELLESFTDPKQALRSIPNLHPEVVFTDLDMPVINGKQVVKRVKALNQNIKVVVLSMHIDPFTIKELMEADIDGYLLKTDDLEDFEHAVKLLKKDKKAFSSSVADVWSSGRVKNGHQHKQHVTLDALSEREKEVLAAVAEGLNSREVADKLFISFGTVETHRKNIMRKLDAKNVADLVRIAVRAGLVW